MTAAKKKPALPTIPYPSDLPDSEVVGDALFWRAAWLRDVGEEQAIRRLIARASFARESTALRYAIYGAETHAKSESKASLDSLIRAGGLPYAWLPEGGVA